MGDRGPYFIGDSPADRFLLGLALGIETRWHRVTKPHLARFYSEADAVRWVSAGMEAGFRLPVESLPKGDVKIVLHISREVLEAMRAMIPTDGGEFGDGGDDMHGE